MILHEQPTAKWTPLDFMIMEAYQGFLAELCPNCNQPVWLCRSEDNRLMVRVKEVACDAMIAIAEAREGRKSEDMEGISFQPEFYMRDDTPLHELRLPYWEAKMKEHAEG